MSSEVSYSYACNAYTAAAASSLKSVGFFTEADNASYTVRIYGTISNGRLSNLLTSAMTGTETYAGYHTIDLATPLSLNAGSKFYVYLNITGGGTYPMAVDEQIAGYDSASTASMGQSYYSSNGTSSWTDLTTWNSTANFCINALVLLPASTAPGTPALAAASDTGMSNSDGITNLDNSSPAKTLQFLVGGTVAGATVTIYADGTAIGSAVASGTSTTVITSGTCDLLDGARSITARQTEPGKSESGDSSAQTIYVDTVAPTATINQASGQVDPTATSPINFTVVFNEKVGDFVAADVTLGGTACGTLAAAVTNPSGDQKTYNVAVSGMAGAGDGDCRHCRRRRPRRGRQRQRGRNQHGQHGHLCPSLVTVVGTTINDGKAQRSMVNSLTVTFSGVVNIDAGAFDVEKTDAGGGPVAVAVATQVVGGKTVATLTFSGSLDPVRFVG